MFDKSTFINHILCIFKPHFSRKNNLVWSKWSKWSKQWSKWSKKWSKIVVKIVDIPLKI